MTDIINTFIVWEIIEGPKVAVSLWAVQKVKFDQIFLWKSPVRLGYVKLSVIYYIVSPYTFT